MRTRAIGSKNKYSEVTKTTIATAQSVAKEIEGPSIMGVNRTYSNRGSKENKYSDSISKPVGKVYTLQLICYRCE